ncbi:hypothetical protein G5I_08968 [Acromyrmex echinatior]|uniref:Uncharacterized protein n=1 Tax=Acromyrmex echinatior TaxID=103372 RepID=F4WSZ6_ACREC|nr:hypothetical protein G5I_08968 [Acromyrmex echinatior]
MEADEPRSVSDTRTSTLSTLYVVVAREPVAVTAVHSNAGGTAAMEHYGAIAETRSAREYLSGGTD